MNVSLVVPTLNEQSNIKILLEKIVASLQTSSAVQEAEIIIVDDGSTDDTVKTIKGLTLAYPVKIIERSVRGLATAVLEGFSQASHEILGVMDADLSHPPELIPSLLANFPVADLVIASRNLPGGMVEEWPWYRKCSSMFATLLTRPLGIKSSDPMSGFFFLKRSVVDLSILSPIGYKILLEILVKSSAVKVVEVPYVFQNRKYGKSKMGLKESVNYARHISRLYYWKLIHHA